MLKGYLNISVNGNDGTDEHDINRNKSTGGKSSRPEQKLWEEKQDDIKITAGEVSVKSEIIFFYSNKF